MRRVGGLVVVMLMVGGCGNEVAGAGHAVTPEMVTTGATAPETPRPTDVPSTPEATRPMPMPTTKLPTRPELPKSAYQQITVARLPQPVASLRVPGDGMAQVVFECDYEEWSPQYEANVRQPELNPPGQHTLGERRGDYLNIRTANRGSLALGSHKDALDKDIAAQSYTEDSWPARKLVTAFAVKRENLTRANVLEARNLYATGCSVALISPLLDAVRVSVYAPWDWTI